MNPEYEEYTKKLNKFNKWELEYLANLPVEQKIQQFIELYDIKPNPKILNRKYKEHLTNLIKINKVLKKSVK